MTYRVHIDSRAFVSNGQYLTADALKDATIRRSKRFAGEVAKGWWHNDCDVPKILVGTALDGVWSDTIIDGRTVIELVTAPQETGEPPCA